VLSNALDEACVPSTSIFLEELGRPLKDLIAAVVEGEATGRLTRVESVDHAVTLLAVLPTGMQAPEIVVERDGQIGFDWHLARDRSLSLNVGRGGMLGYAAVIGLESSYGRVPFGGTIPPAVSRLFAALSSSEQALGRR
jgi:hypothetical protein